MLLPNRESEQMSIISVLFTVSFGALLAIGTVAMSFESANFSLGFILFLLGLLLMLGNEYLSFKKQKARTDRAMQPLKMLSGLIGFAVVAYVFPSAIALLLYFAYGWGERILAVAIAGFIVTTVKVAAKTAQIVFAK